MATTRTPRPRERGSKADPDHTSRIDGSAEALGHVPTPPTSSTRGCRTAATRRRRRRSAPSRIKEASGSRSTSSGRRQAGRDTPRHPLRPQRRRRVRPRRLQHRSPPRSRSCSASASRGHGHHLRGAHRQPAARAADRLPRRPASNRVRMATGGAFFWGFFSDPHRHLDRDDEPGHPVPRPPRLGDRQEPQHHAPEPALGLLPDRVHGRACSTRTASPTTSARSSARCWPVRSARCSAPACRSSCSPSRRSCFVAIAFGKLREPKRGVYERLAAGRRRGDRRGRGDRRPASARPSACSFNNKSARRIYYSLPFLIVSAASASAPSFSLFYDEIYSLGPFQRGLIAVVGEALQIAGLVFGFSYVQKLMSKNPGRSCSCSPSWPCSTPAHVAGTLASSTCWCCRSSSRPSAPAPRPRSSPRHPGRHQPGGAATHAARWASPPAPSGTCSASPSSSCRRHRRQLRHPLGPLFVLPIYLARVVPARLCGWPLNDDIKNIQESALTQAEARKRRLDGDPQMMVIRGLNAGYDQTQILFDVDFEVADGEIIALLGTNGAGKSTLLKAISGIIQPMSGAIIFDGEDITNADAIQSAHMGIAQVPGGRGIFPTPDRRREPAGRRLDVPQGQGVPRRGDEERHGHVPDPAQAGGHAGRAACPAASSRCCRCRRRSSPSRSC